jgi:hypothetical protein
MASGRRDGRSILIFRSANYDAWETNDFFPFDGRMTEFSLAVYECLSACKSKGQNLAASGTNVSLRLPISVNATVSISSLVFLSNFFRLTSSVVRSLSIIIVFYVLSRKLMSHWLLLFSVSKMNCVRVVPHERQRTETTKWVNGLGLECRKPASTTNP